MELDSLLRIKKMFYIGFFRDLTLEIDLGHIHLEGWRELTRAFDTITGRIDHEIATIARMRTET